MTPQLVAFLIPLGAMFLVSVPMWLKAEHLNHVNEVAHKAKEQPR